MSYNLITFALKDSPITFCLNLSNIKSNKGELGDKYEDFTYYIPFDASCKEDISKEKAFRLLVRDCSVFNNNVTYNSSIRMLPSKFFLVIKESDLKDPEAAIGYLTIVLKANLYTLFSALTINEVNDINDCKKEKVPPENSTRACSEVHSTIINDILVSSYIKEFSEKKQYADIVVSFSNREGRALMNVKDYIAAVSRAMTIFELHAPECKLIQMNIDKGRTLVYRTIWPFGNIIKTFIDVDGNLTYPSEDTYKKISESLGKVIAKI